MSTSGFKDHFSGVAAHYADFRPTYPAELFAWLANQVPGNDLVWDCATGSGQAAVGLAQHFSRVIANVGNGITVPTLPPPTGLFLIDAATTKHFA